MEGDVNSHTNTAKICSAALLFLMGLRANGGMYTLCLKQNTQKKSATKMTRTCKNKLDVKQHFSVEVISLKTRIEFHEMLPVNMTTVCQNTRYFIFVELVVTYLITGHIIVALDKIYSGP